MKKNAILAVIMTVICINAVASAQNVLVNGDFESSPPPNCGNNVGWSVSPWVLGTGETSNVVTVDGGGTTCPSYGSNGPQSDASAPGAGVKQHYLDITNGSNDFYQSFTPQCSGKVIFGGSFSTRGNSPGTASVTLRQGIGTSGNIVGQSNAVSLPGGNSRTDPWTLISFTAPIIASTTYSFIVHMDNNMNFDNGFVRYELACDPPVPVDPCCPPWNKDMLKDMMFYKGQGSISANYTLEFQPTTSFNNQMQAYLNYLNSINPAITQIIIDWRLHDRGTGNLPSTGGNGPQIGSTSFTSWIANGSGVPSVAGPPIFSTPTAFPMQVGTWYMVHTGIFLNNGQKFFPDDCSVNEIFVRIQVLFNRGGRNKPVLEVSDGKSVIKRIPIELQ